MNGIFSTKRLFSTCWIITLLTHFTPASAAKKTQLPPAPVHPDTLPTLLQSWNLPAALAPRVTNTYAPRFATAGDQLAIYDHHGHHLALVETKSAKVLWHTNVPSRSGTSFSVTPLITDETVVVASNGYVVAYDRKTGKRAYQVATKGAAINTLAQVQHHLFVSWVKVSGQQILPEVNIWGIDTRKARVEWAKKIPGQLGYLASGENVGYYVGSNGHVMAFTSDRGEPVWQTTVEGQITAAPLTAPNSGMLYITSHVYKTSTTGGHTTRLYAINTTKGTVAWQQRFASTQLTALINGQGVASLTEDGRLASYDAASGKKSAELMLPFTDAPTSLLAVAAQGRIYVFTSHVDGNGYIWLIDSAKQRVLATANALDMKVLTLVPQDKQILLDGVDGQLYAYQLDQSERPKRLSIEPTEFAQELISDARAAKAPAPQLTLRLAGLGPKALPAIIAALDHANPHVVFAAADAIRLLEAKTAVPALIKTLQRLASTAPGSAHDPITAVVSAISAIKDPRAISALTTLMHDTTQPHQRRRLGYVGLGAIGTAAALAPLQKFRTELTVKKSTWQPVATTTTVTNAASNHVEYDANGRGPISNELKEQTTKTIQPTAGQTYMASISPYLGGYNDVWIGLTDASGQLIAPLFTGLTHAESQPGKHIRIAQLTMPEKDKFQIALQTRSDAGGWQLQPTVTLDVGELTADRDQDRLPDVVERRLQLCMTLSDCDGDGISDAEDLNPLATAKAKLTAEQQLFQEAFFAYYAFIQRRGIVIVDPGTGPSFEVYGRRDPVISLRRSSAEKLRKEAGLNAIDYVSFGGPYAEGAAAGEAADKVEFALGGKVAKIGMDIMRAGDNSVGYNVTLERSGKNWIVTKMDRVWSTN